MKKILSAILENKKNVILATIVSHTGSVPRQTGAQMLVDETGLIAGTIGGGSAEYNAINRAKELLKHQACGCAEYSSTENFTSINEMICGGSIAVWFAYIDISDKNSIAVFEDAMKLINKRIAFHFIQLYNKKSNIIKSAIETINDDDTGLIHELRDLDSEFKVCKLMWKPFPRAVIFGAGHVAQALVSILSTLEFECVIIDDREHIVDLLQESHVKNPLRFEPTVILGDFNNIDASVSIETDDYCIIMTSGHLCDYSVLRQVLNKSCAYVGLMGSRKKVSTINSMLEKEGFKLEDIARVHTPIGLSIGAVTPAEIAVSVAAECIGVRRGKI